jgi:ABC-type glycerol-3-phosphate transport system substrate-binding protein
MGAALGATPLLLVGCSAGPPLTVGTQFAQLPGLLDAYNRTGPPAKVKAVAVPTNVDLGQPPLPKQLPDIVDVTATNLWVGGLGVASGTSGRVGPFLRPLDGLLPPSVLSALVPTALESLRLKGALYGLPYSFAHGLLAFNDLLAVPAGFAPPVQPMDLGQLGAVLRRASPKLPPGTVGIDLVQIDPPVWGTMVAGVGGQLTSGGRFTFAQGPGLSILDQLGSITRAYGGANTFSSGHALFSFGFGSNGAAAFDKANGMAMGLLPFLRLPRPLSPALALGAGISLQCRNVKAAAAFLSWLAGPTAQRYLDAHGAPSARSDLQSDTAWVPPLPPGDDANVALAAPGEVLPHIFWHPAILFILANAQVAAFSPGAGSTVSEVFTTAERACNAALGALGLTAD